MNTLAKRETFNSAKPTLKVMNTVSGVFSIFTGVLRQSRLLQLLLALLVAQLILSLVLHTSSSRRTSFATGAPLFSFAANDVSKLEIQSDGGGVTLSKDSGEWRIDGELKMPVQTGKVESILETIAALDGGLPIANSETAREQLKVAQGDFIRRVIISGDTIEPISVLLGSSPGLRKSHLRVEDNDDIYSASLPVSDFPSDVNDWLDKSLLSFNNVTSVEVNNIRFSLTGTGDEKLWSVIKPEDDNRSVDNPGFDEAIASLQSLRVSGLSDNASGTDQDELENTVVINVIADESEAVLTLVKRGDVITAERDDVSGVFTLTAPQYEQLLALETMESYMMNSTESDSTESDDLETEAKQESSEN